MDVNKLEQIGEDLRSVGHKRREIVEQIVQEVMEGDFDASKDLYMQLSDVSDQAIEIIDRQKQLIDDEMQKM